MAVRGKKSLASTLLVFYGLTAQATGIRHLRVTKDAVYKVHLSVARSTLIQLGATAQKIIIGDTSLVRIARIENDLSIEALRNGRTNLFAFTDRGVFVFDLSVSQNSFDDIVTLDHMSKQKEVTPGKNRQLNRGNCLSLKAQN